MRNKNEDAGRQVTHLQLARKESSKKLKLRKQHFWEDNFMGLGSPSPL